MLRAVLEGVAYSQKDCLDVLREMGVSFDQMLVTGGGARSPLLRQMLADNYNCPVVMNDSKEGSALGAAILAGVGTGLYDSVSTACQSILSGNPAQVPDRPRHAAYTPFYKLYKEIYAQLTDQFPALAKL